MDIFKSLLKAEQAEQVTSDLNGRSFGVAIAVVADVQDPANLGRIRVLLASNGAKSLSDWLVRLTPSKLISVPLVNVGDTVVVSFVNGDPKNGVYLGVVNNLPQPPAKEIANTVSINGETATVQTIDSFTIAVGENYIGINKDQVVLSVGGTRLNLTNGGLAITGVSSATINGKAIMLVGGKDTDGDTMTTSGL